MSKKSSDHLTRGSEKPPGALTLWMVTLEGGQIISRLHEITGPVQLFASSRYEVPPEWLERCIPLTDDQEDKPCR